MTLDRRTPLPRGPGPRRHKRINPVSESRAGTAVAYEQLREAVYIRDGRRCLLAGSALGRCVRGLTPHHLWKSGQSGPDHPCNIITLCPFHNGNVESMDRLDAEALGLVVRWGETCAHAWRRLVFHGIVHYWFDGRLVASNAEPDIPGHPYHLVRA